VVCEDSTTFTQRCEAEGKEDTVTLSLDRETVNAQCVVSCPAGATNFQLQGILEYYASPQWGYNETMGEAVKGRDQDGSESWLPAEIMGIELEWPEPLRKLAALISGKMLLAGVGLGLAGCAVLQLVARLQPLYKGYRLLSG
jgi:hypothetical protein